MRKIALLSTVNRQPGPSASAAATLTRFSTGFLPGLLMICALMLLTALPAMAQSTATVTIFTDTNSVDGSGNPGLGAGTIDGSGNMDLRYALNQAIAAGGRWTIKFPSCSVTTPCAPIVLSNPLPPITALGLNLTIDGGEFGAVTIDGASQYRIFFIDDANVTLANLQIQNALAQGGAGGYGTWLGGGGGAGLGAGVFVNQSNATLSAQNTYFLNCQVVGGNGGSGDNSFIGGGSGGGGGMAFSGGNTDSLRYNGAGGGGILAVGNGGASFHGGNGGAGGGGGGGVDDQVPFEDTPPNDAGGFEYGDNPGGNQPGDSSNGANGGFGGGGGGAAAYISSNLLIYAADGGNGGFGGGGGGGSESGSSSANGVSNIGGFGGGNGGGTDDGIYGGGGGSAYGPSIFINTGSATIYNSGYLNDSGHTAATAGLGAGGAANGNANETAAFNNAGMLSGPLPSALPATHFSVSISPTTITLGTAATITVTALDSNGDPTIAYNGVAKLTVTDGNSQPIAISPTSLTFTNGQADSNAMTLNTVDWDITVTATDQYWSYITGTSSDITMTETLVLAPVSTTLPSGTVGVAYSQSFTASGGSGNYTYAVAGGTTLPAGLSLSSAGVLSGIPAVAGPASVTVVATDTTYTNQSGVHYTVSKQYSLLVNQGTPAVAVTLTNGVTPIFLDNAVTFTAAVTNVGNTPTGTAAFYDNGTALTACASQVLASGLATCTINTIANPLTVGSNVITASYSGDSNFVAVLNTASTSVTEFVADFSIGVSNSTDTVIPGNAATYTFTVSPVDPSTIYPAQINLSISGLPTGATYTYTPSDIAACGNSCATSVTLVIHTVLNNTTSERQPGDGVNPATGVAPYALALLLLPFAGRLRRAAKGMGRMLVILLMAGASLVAIACVSGCGSSVGFFGQQQATHTVTITATSGSLVHTSPVTLTVE